MTKEEANLQSIGGVEQERPTLSGVLNPDAANKFFTKKTETDAEFNQGLSLEGIRRVQDLEEYDRWSGRWYQIERIVKNTPKQFLTESIILDLLVWDAGHHKEYAEYILDAVTNHGLMTPTIIEWTLQNSEQGAFKLFERGRLSPEQTKTVLVEGKSAHIKSRILESGRIKSQELSLEEIEKLFFAVPLNDRWLLVEDIMRHCLSNKGEAEQKEFVDKIFVDIINEFKEGHKVVEKVGKEYREKRTCGRPGHKSCFTSFSSSSYRAGSSSEDQHSNIEYYAGKLSVCRKYLDDDQLLQLIELAPSERYWTETMPGWFFRGLELKYGKSRSRRDYELKALEDAGRLEYKAQYDLVNQRFGVQEVSIDKILTKQEQIEMVQEIQDFGVRLFEPILVESAGTNKDTIMFRHISGQADLKYLLPRVPRSVNRQLQDAAVFLQRGEYDGFQIDHLEKVNGLRLHEYKVPISRDDLQKGLVFADPFWDRGYQTKRPIVFDKDTILTWGDFNTPMREATINKYERLFGKLPFEIKKQVLDGNKTKSTHH
jgi:hypothetical protein